MHLPKTKVNNPLPLVTILALVLGVSACKSDKLPTFPTNSRTPSIPIPTSGGIPSPVPSIPSPTSSPSGSPSPPGAPSSPSSPGSPGSSGPSAPSMPSPGLPDISGKSGGSSGDVAKSSKKGGGQSGEESSGKPPGQQGEQGDGQPGSPRESRTAAGDDLQKAGDRIAKAGSGEFDPLIPETDTDSEDESDDAVFADGASGSKTSSESDGESSTQGSETGIAGQDSGIELPPGLEEEIREAQEAIAKAGEALQEAGEAVANAETDEELAAAEDLLGDARIAVIVATQGVETIEEDLSVMPDFGEGAKGDIFSDTNAALQDANVALVIATRSILIAKTGSAEFPEGAPNGGAAGNEEVAALEDELDESLVIFDGQIGDARDAVLTSTAPPTTSGSGNRSSLPEGSGVPTTSEQGELMQLPADPTEDTPEEQQIATAEMPDLNQGDIPDAQGDDIVATQLREAAMAETDTELQAKLWQEYKRYKEGL